MAMLTKALPDSANKVISFALGNPGLYHLALKTLKKKYGHPKVIASAHLAAIKSLPHVSDPNDFAGLYDFSISLSGAVGALVATGYDHELTASSLLHTILEKNSARYSTEMEFVRVQSATKNSYDHRLRYLAGKASLRPIVDRRTR